MTLSALPAVAVIWLVFVAALVLLLIVFVEISRSNRRRERGEMFASDSFNRKTAELGLSFDECACLERLARQSSFSNKDAVLNSPLLFEKAVNDFYELHGGAENVSPVERRIIFALRSKLGHLESADKSSYVSSRQFSLGKNVTVSLPVEGGGSESVHAQVDSVDEVEWGVRVDNPERFRPFVGGKLPVRLNIPGEAVYSASVRVVGLVGNSLRFEHSVRLHKEQLRRWIRLAVRLPVHLDAGNCEQDGFLVDLSAGGILLSLPKVVPEDSLVRIRFCLPGFGEENLQVRILRQLHGGRFDDVTGGIDHSASFIGDFGEVQEHVLQYIFREREAQKMLK